MVVTYTGILREQGRIEWDGPVPDRQGAHVAVIVLDAVASPMFEHARMLQHLTDSGRAIETVIPDPVAWQKEMRSERARNGRDDG